MKERMEGITQKRQTLPTLYKKQMENGFVNAYGYIRVSTDKQAGEDAYGIDLQKSAIERYAKEHRYAITEWLIDIGSGVSDERPSLEKLFRMPPNERSANTIIIFKSDRLARDTKLYFYYLFCFEKNEIAMKCITEEFEEGSEFANLYRSMMMFVAEQERKNIMIRTRRGIEEKRKNGGYVGGKIPYGYNVENGNLVVNLSERWIVQYIFYRRGKGISTCKIAEELDRRGYKKRNGTTFTANAVRSVLLHEQFYLGYVEYDGELIKGKHAALITEEGLKITPPERKYLRDLKKPETLSGRYTEAELEKLKADLTSAKKN